MYITSIPNRSSPPAILLRESFRENGKVKSRTLANLSKLPKDAVDLLKRHLAGDRFVGTDEAFDYVESWHHGHVQAVRCAMKRLGFDRLVATRRSRERDLVLAMVTARILAPDSKLATTRNWQVTSVPRVFGVGDADEDELYAAMDWLLERQDDIEAGLASRHLKEGGLVLYDLTSSYFEGTSCALAARGYNRDGKKGKLQVNYGLLTDERGCPVAISVFDGRTVDTKTLMPQVERVRQRFGIRTLALVGDRGMISQTRIDRLKDIEGVDWVTALRSGSIKKLVEADAVQLDLFDRSNLFELSHPDYPGERLVACRNPLLAERRAKTRLSLLEATTKELENLRNLLDRGKIKGKERIAERVRASIGKCVLAEHLVLDIGDEDFEFQLNDRRSAADALLDAVFKRIERVRSSIRRGTLKGRDKIGVRLERLLKKHKLEKHVRFELRDDGFDVRIGDRRGAADRALESLCEHLEKIRILVKQGRFGGKDKIGMRIGKVIDRYNVAKHFVLDIRDDGFEFSRNMQTIDAEAALDGIYIIRTSLDEKRLSADGAVRGYKSLGRVERAFRSIKTVDLKVRPIYHYSEPRVRAHIFLCMLAYYVEWYMREAWRPLLFCDEELEEKNKRDPVAPAQRSASAEQKAHTKILGDGSPVHSFQSLIQLLSGIVLNTARVPGALDDRAAFEIATTPNATQRRALDLLEGIRV
jgi:transposase